MTATLLVSSSKVTPKSPLNIDECTRLQPGDLSYDTKNIYRYELKYVIINGNGVIYKWFQLFPESIIDKTLIKDHPRFYFGLKLFKDIIKRRLKKLPRGKYLSIFDQWTSNHYHLHADFLPRLLLIDEKELANCTIILRDTKYGRRVIKDILQAFNFTVKNIIFIKVSNAVLVKDCLFISKPVSSGFSHPSLVQQLRKRLSMPPIRPSKRVFCARANKNWRTILNEHEVEKTLKEFGFASVDFDTLSIIQQIEMFMTTQILAGINGAGLTNAIYMQEGTHLIEFSKDSSDNFNNEHWYLTSACNIHYTMIKGQPLPGNENDPQHTCNLVVDVDQLKSALKSIVAQLSDY